MTSLLRLLAVSAILLTFLPSISNTALAAAGASSSSELSLDELSEIARSPDGRTFYTGDLIIYYRGITPKAAIGGSTWTRGELIYQFSGQTTDSRLSSVLRVTPGP